MNEKELIETRLERCRYIKSLVIKKDRTFYLKKLTYTTTKSVPSTVQATAYERPNFSHEHRWFVVTNDNSFLEEASSHRLVAKHARHLATGNRINAVTKLVVSIVHTSIRLRRPRNTSIVCERWRRRRYTPVDVCIVTATRVLWRSLHVQVLLDPPRGNIVGNYNSSV